MIDVPKHAIKAFEGVIFDVWQWEQELFDGTKATFEAIGRSDSAFSIGVLDDRKILLAMDEQPHHGKMLSLIGGRIEVGESPEEGAKREFLEESGYEIGELRHYLSEQLGSIARWQTHIFIARDLKKIQEPALDPGEKIELQEFTFDEFIKLGQRRDFRNLEMRMRLMEAELDKSKKEELYNLVYG